MKSIKNSNLSYWFITLGLVFGFTLPFLVQHGMFQDAMLYSGVAHNLSIGFGSFWFLEYSTLNLEGIPTFHEQLPLVFGIQSIFFKVLGDSIYIERFYTFLMLILHLLLINTLWKEIFKGKTKYAEKSWLPIFLWIITPVCYWTFRNNMLENTVSVFALSSIIISYKQVKADKSNWLMWVLSGILVFLASFSKGVPGLFPVAFPFLYWVITKSISFKQTLVYSTILTVIPILFYIGFYLYPTSNESLSIYLNDRLLNRVSNTDGFRFQTAWRLFQELIPIFIFCTITYSVTRIKKIKSKFTENSKEALLFIAIGLSAILPLMLTLVQKGFYMTPGLSYIAIGFAAITVPSITSAIEVANKNPLANKLIRIFGILLIIVSTGLTISQMGKISRNQEMITDIHKINEVVPNFATLTVPEEMYYQYDFVLQGYLVRYFNISISPYKEYRYYLKKKTDEIQIPKSYTLIDLDLTLYELYQNIDRPVKELTAQPTQSGL